MYTVPPSQKRQIIKQLKHTRQANLTWDDNETNKQIMCTIQNLMVHQQNLDLKQSA